MTEWLVSLPHDIKMLYEAAADQDLARGAREVAVGAIISTIGQGHLPGVPPDDFSNYCDSAILLRMALQRIVAIGGEDAETLRSRFDGFFASLDEDLALCREAIGDRYEWLEQKLERLPTLTYKGKKIADYLDDDDASAFLYEEGLEFRTEYEVDEDLLGDRLKKAQTILDALDKRRQSETR
ncbi:MAG: hypothetical protein D6689_05060 [Deltaproteobacteria bacterium]|nr:MAG: hypothetical protein D6689_05060 [Deltaproteobacteria bacterium]